LLTNLTERCKLGVWSLSGSIQSNKFQDEVFAKNTRISAAVLHLKAVHNFQPRSFKWRLFRSLTSPYFVLSPAPH